MKRAWVLALLAACGGSSVGSDANGGGGPDAPPPAHTGGVGFTVNKAVGSSPNASSSAYAQFNSAAPQCTTSHRTGPCYLQQCTTAVTTVSAGTITITGGSQPITLTPGTTGQYNAFGATIDLAHPGDQLTVTAQGKHLTFKRER